MSWKRDLVLRVGAAVVVVAGGAYNSAPAGAAHDCVATNIFDESGAVVGIDVKCSSHEDPGGGGNSNGGGGGATPTTTKPKPVVTAAPEVNDDGDLFGVSIDYDDNSAPIAGEIDTLEKLPFGGEVLDLVVTTSSGLEVPVREHLERAATNSLPADIRNRLAELEELGRLQTSILDAGVDADNDNIAAGPGGTFNVLLHQSGLFGGDLDDSQPGSLDLVTELRSAGVDLAQPVQVVLPDGTNIDFESGFQVLLNVGDNAYDYVPEWRAAVDQREADLAAAQAATHTALQQAAADQESEPPNQSGVEEASAPQSSNQSAASSETGGSTRNGATGAGFAAVVAAVAGIMIWLVIRRRKHGDDSETHTALKV